MNNNFSASQSNQRPSLGEGLGVGRRIILIGYMGAGKTTIGRALAQRLGIPFYDLDWYIETRRHRSVAQIFAEIGEEGFRQIEHNLLHEVAEFEDVIISCGGGTPCFFDNIDYMNRQGQVVYLKATPEVLIRHLQMGRTERPLIKGKDPQQLADFINEQLARREAFYLQARYHFDVSLLDNREKINDTIEKLIETLSQ